MKKNSFGKAGRFAALILAFLVLLASASGSAAEGEKWNLFDRIAEQIEGEVPESAAQIMQRDLYRETINNVEITVREAGYDGRTLFLQYSYRMLDVDVPLGLKASEVYGEDLPDGMDPDSYVDGYMTDEAEDLLYSHQVGWWMDGIWINGKELGDMPDGSGQYLTGTGVPGELVETDFWRLDNVNVFLEGKVQISLPIGEQQDLEDYTRDEHPDRYGEDGLMKLPEKGIITFEYDAADILGKVHVYHPGNETVLPEVTVWIRETAFSPVMTYVKMNLAVNEDALAAYKAENGEGYIDDNGELLWEYSGMDVFGKWIESLQLADGNGNILFPGSSGPGMYGDTEAEFLLPCLETLPDELYLVPVSDESGPDLSRAIRLLPAEE